jgi:hypothetical protein
MLFEKIQLEESEEVLKIVRKHWFVIVAELFGVFLMLLAPFIIFLVYLIIPTESLPFIPHPEEHIPLIAYGIIIWLLFAIMTGFMIWTHYYLDLWIITDRRIIVVDQIQFFNRKVSSFRLERLQDLRMSIDGILATFLNFGTIRAQTAGMGENSFKTTGLPDPRKLQSIIQKATDKRIIALNRLQHSVGD